MEANDNNKNNLKYNVITEYLENKCEKDEKFKDQLNEIVDIAQKKYEELDMFLKDNKKVIYQQKIKLGFGLLQKNQLIVQKISSMFDPNELDIFEQFKQYKDIIDPINIKIYKLNKKEKEEIKGELQNIKQNENDIMDKISQTKNRLKELRNFNKDKNKEKKEVKIPEENITPSYNNENLIQNNEDSLNKIDNEFNINENNINLKEQDDVIKESNESKTDSNNAEIKYLKEKDKYLFGQFISMKKDKRATKLKLMNLRNEISELKKENPLNKLEKYDKLVVMYFNKIQYLNDFIKKASSKIYAKLEKRPKFK